MLRRNKKNEQPIAIRAKMFKEVYYDKFLNDFDFVTFNKLLTDHFMQSRFWFRVSFKDKRDMGDQKVKAGSSCLEHAIVMDDYEKELKRYLEERGFKVYDREHTFSVSFD